MAVLNEIGGLTRRCPGNDAQFHWAALAASVTSGAVAAARTGADNCCTLAPHVRGPAASSGTPGPSRTDARADGTSGS